MENGNRKNWNFLIYILILCNYLTDKGLRELEFLIFFATEGKWIKAQGPREHRNPGTQELKNSGTQGPKKRWPKEHKNWNFSIFYHALGRWESIYHEDIEEHEGYVDKKDINRPRIL